MPLDQEFSLIEVLGELPQSSIRPTLAHTGLPKPKNIEKPVVFEAFSLEMLKKHWFLKLWAHLDRAENDFDSSFTPKMLKKSHEHDLHTAPEMHPRPAAQGFRHRASSIQSSCNLPKPKNIQNCWFLKLLGWKC